MFEICVISDLAHDPEVEFGRGSIRIGEFQEEFEIDFEYWRSAQYELQWRRCATDY